MIWVNTLSHTINSRYLSHSFYFHLQINISNTGPPGEFKNQILSNSIKFYQLYLILKANISHIHNYLAHFLRVQSKSHYLKWRSIFISGKRGKKGKKGDVGDSGPPVRNMVFFLFIRYNKNMNTIECIFLRNILYAHNTITKRFHQNLFELLDHSMSNTLKLCNPSKMLMNINLLVFHIHVTFRPFLKQYTVSYAIMNAQPV